MLVEPQFHGPNQMNSDELIYLPLLGDIVFAAHEQLHRPNDQSEENVHPPPPDLGRVI